MQTTINSTSIGRVAATRSVHHDPAISINGNDDGVGRMEPIQSPTIISESMHRGDSKYFRNIVTNTAAAADKSKMHSSHNDLNVQINRTAPIKSVKLLNNLNALKLK